MKSWMRFALCLFLSSAALFSQSYKGQGRMTGVVTDQAGKPLEGVKVKLFSLKGQSGFELVTDAKGEWKAIYIRGGGWNLDFEKSGYMPKKISTNIEESFRNPVVDTKLQKAEGLVITEELKAALKQGNQLFEGKKYEEAIQAYEDLIAKNPDAYVIQKNIGNCYFELQKYDKAEDSYRKVLDKEPQNAEIMLLVGNCYANRGDNDQAMEWYNKIQFENIKDQAVLFNIGSKFYSQSKFEEALKYYKRAVELKTDFLDAIYQLGLTYIALQNTPDAVQVFESYLKLDADSPKAAQVKGFLEYLKKKAS
jgi:tetratricopeptide (TPR) repeat protein